MSEPIPEFLKHVRVNFLPEQVVKALRMAHWWVPEGATMEDPRNVTLCFSEDPHAYVKFGREEEA